MDTLAPIQLTFDANGYSTILVWGTNTDDARVKALAEHRKTGRKVLVIAVIDDERPMELDEHAFVIFRTSCRRNWLRANEFVMPYIWERPRVVPAALAKGSVPRVGFCGFVYSHPVRLDAVQCLLRSQPRLVADFVLRDRFWAGKPNDPDVVRAFDDNMARNEFNLCVRGAGNFSMRFYQTLAAGRIPVLVDTGAPLPLEHLIDWKSVCVIADTANNLPDAICRFWETKDIEMAQRDCLDVYERFFKASVLGGFMLEEIARRQSSLSYTHE